MPGPNKFSEFRDDGAVDLKFKATSPFRRVRHSASNWGRSKSKGDIAKAGAEQVATTGLAVGGAVGGALTVAGAGTASTAAVAFGVGSATAATAAAGVLCAPALAFAGCLIGLGFLAKSMYSNRDKNHNILSRYVYSLIDDQPPHRDIHTDDGALEEAAKAAAYLLKEGPSQLAIMGRKLQEREAPFWVFRNDYLNQTVGLHGDSWRETQAEMIQYQSTAPGNRTVEHIEAVVANHERLNANKIKAEKLLKDGWKTGGKAFEFMRRLVHCGNYLQAPGVLSIATYKKIGTGYPDRGDPFQGWPQADRIRDALDVFSQQIEEVDRNYATWEAWAIEQGVRTA